MTELKAGAGVEDLLSKVAAAASRDFKMADRRPLAEKSPLYPLSSHLGFILEIPNATI